MGKEAKTLAESHQKQNGRKGNDAKKNYSNTRGVQSRYARAKQFRLLGEKTSQKTQHKKENAREKKGHREGAQGRKSNSRDHPVTHSYGLKNMNTGRP